MRIDTDKEIVRILPHAYEVKLTEELHQWDFRTHWKYSKRMYYAFRPLWWAMHFWDWLIADRFVPKLSFGLATLNSFSSPGTGDGFGTDNDSYRSVTSESWATIVAGAGTNLNFSGSNTNVCVTRIAAHASSSGQWTTNCRGFFHFNTSAIASGTTITSATLSLSVVTTGDTANYQPDLNVYQSTVTAADSVASTDYPNVGSTAFSTAIPYAVYSANVNVYSAWTLNASGINNITLGATSKFCVRNANYDAANSSPTWSAGGASTVYVFSAETAGNGFDPKLTVVFSLAGQGFFPQHATVGSGESRSDSMT